MKTKKNKLYVIKGKHVVHSDKVLRIETKGEVLEYDSEKELPGKSKKEKLTKKKV